MIEKGYMRRRILKKLLRDTYRVHPKHFGKIAAKKAIDDLRESLEEKDRLKG